MTRENKLDLLSYVAWLTVIHKMLSDTEPPDFEDPLVKAADKVATRCRLMLEKFLDKYSGEALAARIFSDG